MENNKTPDIEFKDLNNVIEDSLKNLISNSTNLMNLSLKELKSDMENLINVIKKTNNMEERGDTTIK